MDEEFEELLAAQDLRIGRIRELFARLSAVDATLWPKMRAFIATGITGKRLNNGKGLVDRIMQGIEFQVLSDDRLRWRVHSDDAIPMAWIEGSPGEMMEHVLRDLEMHRQFLSSRCRQLRYYRERGRKSRADRAGHDARPTRPASATGQLHEW